MSASRFKIHALILTASLVLPSAAHAGSLRSVIPGPVEAELVAVVDGDTILVNARPWPQHSVAVLVRLRGIDAPEMKSRCPAKRDAAMRARQALAAIATGGIRLTNIAGDKYFGRVVADVSTSETADLAAALMAAGLVTAYDGGRKARESC